MTPAPGIPNFSFVNPGAFRGGQPQGLAWNWLKDEAVVTRIVKLNLESEASDQPARDLGLEVVYKPIDLAEQIIFKPNYDDVLAAVNAIAPGTFVHCEHGQDRTGLVIGCYRYWKQGWQKADAYAEMLQQGFHPELLGLTLFWEWAV
jgi:hypothetical protein